MPEVEVRLTLHPTRGRKLDWWSAQVLEPNTGVQLAYMEGDGTRECVEKRARDWCQRTGLAVVRTSEQEAPYREVTE